MADFTPGKRALLLLDDESPALWGPFTYATSDPALVALADGGEYRLAVLAVAEGTATITVTRNSDGATATVDATVVAATPGDPAGPFTIHLGEPY